MNISPASGGSNAATSDPAHPPVRVADGLRRRASRLLFSLAARIQDAAVRLDGETIDVPTSDVPPRPWSMADEVELMLADQKAELDAHDARSALLANVEPAVLRKPVAPIKRGAALRAVKGKP